MVNRKRVVSEYGFEFGRGRGVVTTLTLQEGSYLTTRVRAYFTPAASTSKAFIQLWGLTLAVNVSRVT